MVTANKFAREKRRFQLNIVIRPGTAKKFYHFAEAKRVGRDPNAYRQRTFPGARGAIRLGRAPTRIDRLASLQTFASKISANAMGFPFLFWQGGFDPKQKGGRFGVGTRPISQCWESTVYPAVRGHFSSDDLRLNQLRFFGFDSSVEGAAGGVSSLGGASAFGSSAAGCAASAAFF